MFHDFVVKGVACYKKCFKEHSIRECAYNETLYDEAVVSEYAYKETFYEEAVVLFSCKGLYSTVEKEHG